MSGTLVDSPTFPLAILIKGRPRVRLLKRIGRTTGCPRPELTSASVPPASRSFV